MTASVNSSHPLLEWVAGSPFRTARRDGNGAGYGEREAVGLVWLVCAKASNFLLSKVAFRARRQETSWLESGKCRRRADALDLDSALAEGLIIADGAAADDDDDGDGVVMEGVDVDVVLARLWMLSESSSAGRARFFFGAKNDVIMM
eukprot:CCRYP_003355-RB/>CCRYP_003355-RB protein AED:0.44 eAED:0.81 QI:0/0/0/1/0/0/3/0/146